MNVVNLLKRNQQSYMFCQKLLISTPLVRKGFHELPGNHYPFYDAVNVTNIFRTIVKAGVFIMKSSTTTDKALAKRRLNIVRHNEKIFTKFEFLGNIGKTLENLNLLAEVEVGNVVEVIRNIDRSLQSLVNSTTVAFKKDNIEIVILRKSVQDGFQVYGIIGCYVNYP